MAASLSVRVNTGASAGTESSAVTGIDMISADNAVNTLANRMANPINAGGRSYEKWLRIRVDVAPVSAVTNFQAWSDGSIDPDTTLFVGTTTTGATPVGSVSSVATTDFATYTSGSKLLWDSASLTTIGNHTKFLVLQWAIAAGHGPGAVAQELLNYSWDET